MTPPSFLRRLLAILYDSLLLACLILFATLLFYWIAGNYFSHDPILRIVYQSYLLILSYLFFGWFWTHGGADPGYARLATASTAADRSPADYLETGAGPLPGRDPVMAGSRPWFPLGAY